MKYNIIRTLLVLGLISLGGCESMSGSGSGTNTGSKFVFGKVLNF